MKRTVYAIISLFFATAAYTAINPITWFQDGSFLGEGYWLNDTGAQGSYATYVTFYGNGWNTVQYRDGSLYLYENVLTIDQWGFFTANVTVSTDPSNPVTYTGYGSCGTSTCQMTVALANGSLQKAWHFDCPNNAIHSVGAIYFNDGTPNIQWEDTILLIPYINDLEQTGK